MDTATIAGRLKDALVKSGLSTRQFQIAMESEGVAGSSTGAVYRYLSGETVPSVDFLASASRVLKVRPAWLILGEEPRTDERIRVLETRTDSESPNEYADRIMRAAIPRWDNLNDGARWLLIELVNRRQVDLEKLAEVGAPVGDPGDLFPIRNAFFRPIEEFATWDLSGDALSDYVVAMYSALVALIPSPRERADLIRKADAAGVAGGSIS